MKNTQDKLAIVFPGQGSQSVGMLGDLSDQFMVIQETFQEASEYLSYDLWQLVQEGPAEKLNQTQFTQPALLAAGIALWRLWQQEQLGMPKVVAGHSLGEYTALCASGALSFRDALILVAKRGELMQSAVAPGQGAMAAILGLSAKEVDVVCQEVEKGVVRPANYNAPLQTVVAGDLSAVELALQIAKTKGAKRTVMLPVSAPIHCILMEPMVEAFTQVLQTVDWSAPQFEILHNYDVVSHQSKESIQQALLQQLTAPVRWVECVQAMAEKGIKKFFECGPGKVLAGLIKKIDGSLEVLNVKEMIVVNN